MRQQQAQDSTIELPQPILDLIDALPSIVRAPMRENTVNDKGIDSDDSTRECG